MVLPQEVQLKGCMSTRPGGSYSKTAGGKVSQTISSSPGSYTSHHSFFPFTNKNGVSSYQWYEYNPSLHKEEKKDGFRYKLILFEGKNLCFPNFNRNKDERYPCQKLLSGVYAVC